MAFTNNAKDIEDISKKGHTVFFEVATGRNSVAKKVASTDFLADETKDVAVSYIAPNANNEQATDVNCCKDSS